MDGLRHRLGTSAIVVHPEGYSDPTDCGPYPCDEWQSFNGGGSAGVEAGGTDGPICKPEDVSRTGWQCYESCKALGYCDDTTDKCRWSHCLDDALFFRAILQYLQRVSTVDDTRLFATGHSNGAMMMYGLASDNKTAPLLAAVAPVAGIPHNGFNVGAPSNTKLRYMEVQGTQDDYVQPYPNVPGRPDKSFGKSYGWYYSAWANTTNLWAKQRGGASRAGATKTMEGARKRSEARQIIGRQRGLKNQVVIEFSGQFLTFTRNLHKFYQMFAEFQNFP